MRTNIPQDLIDYGNSRKVTCGGDHYFSSDSWVGSVYDRRRSNMDQQAVQVWRRRGLNIAEVAFYSVLVVVITLVSVYVPA
jgi:hypothetical protein